MYFVYKNVNLWLAKNFDTVTQIQAHKKGGSILHESFILRLFATVSNRHIYTKHVSLMEIPKTSFISINNSCVILYSFLCYCRRLLSSSSSSLFLHLLQPFFRSFTTIIRKLLIFFSCRWRSHQLVVAAFFWHFNRAPFFFYWNKKRRFHLSTFFSLRVYSGNRPTILHLLSLVFFCVLSILFFSFFLSANTPYSATACCN